ncbi:MAG: hypothetical protein LUG48_04640, partial [Klebsiella quasipneumoniae]|nr:hypothetical protein [Klebsiella quasipneumoniae]
YEDRDTGKVTRSQYHKLTALYEAEQAELLEALARLDGEIAAQKKCGMEQLMKGANLVGIAPFLRSSETFYLAEELTDYMNRRRAAIPE